MEYDLFSAPMVALFILFFFAGILDAVCGGGGLLTVPTFLAIGFPVRLISGTNQCCAFPGGITAMLRYLRHGKIYWPTAIVAAIVSLAGGAMGARLNLLLPEKVLHLIMLILVPVVAVAVLIKRDSGTENRVTTLTKTRQYASAVAIGLAVGIYQGFYGAGAGTFWLLAFAYGNRLDLVTASGNAKVCGVFSSLSAIVTYALSGGVLWQVVLPAALLNIVGNYIGAGLAVRKGAKLIRPMFFVVLGLLFLRLAASVVAGA